MVPTINMNDVNIILSHLKDNICNNDDTLYEYLVNWLAFVVQKPKKPGVVPLCIGKGGIGKTMFWEWFAKHIIGEHNCVLAATLSDISCKFNAHMANKKFVVVNEVKGGSKHDHDVLKSLITDSTVKLEAKGKDSVSVGSSHCIAIISNHKNHHFIDDDCRRFCVIACNPEKKDKPYFTRLGRAMEDASNDFYSYLMQINLLGFNPEDFPKVALRDEIAESNDNSVVAFLKEYTWIEWKPAKDIC
jgi:hypothetical protein